MSEEVTGPVPALGIPESPGTAETGGHALTPEFEAAYVGHSQAVYYLALRLLGDPIQAQDASQEVFVKAFRNWGRFRGGSEVRTWLYRITVNHCSNLRRAWSARHIHTSDDGELLDRQPARSGDPLTVLVTKELGDRIARALETLPEEYRLLLLLVADEELSYEQVGELTDQTTDAVRGKLHRARRAFTAAFTRSA
jgi:RNA polymerase sigma-70 factor (ECF subfamily)